MPEEFIELLLKLASPSIEVEKRDCRLLGFPFWSVLFLRDNKVAAWARRGRNLASTRSREAPGLFLEHWATVELVRTWRMRATCTIVKDGG